MNEVCGTCKYHRVDPDSQEDWICANEHTEHYSDWTTYGDTCSDYESRYERSRK